MSTWTRLWNIIGVQFSGLNEIMDLNQIPIEAKMETKNMVNLDISSNNVLQESRVNNSEVGKRCSEVEGKCLALLIRNKDTELEGIKEKIRVLECERVRVEEEVKGLMLKKANLDGMDVSEEAVMVAGELGKVGRESDGEWNIDELLVENKVLECEKRAAVGEIEEWKRKCKEFELRVRELEEKLSKNDKGGAFIGVKEGVKVVNVGSSSTCSPGGIQIEGVGVSKTVGPMNDEEEIGGGEENYTLVQTPKRKRALTVVISDDELEENEATPRSRAFKIANSDRDGEYDSDDDDGPLPIKRIVNEAKRSCQSDAAANDDRMNVEDEIGGEGNDTSVKTPKRKRDLTVFTSDDELDENEAMPKRRIFKIDDSDNEDQDVDALPTKLFCNGVNRNCHTGDDDDDDGGPTNEDAELGEEGNNTLVRTPEKMGDFTVVTTLTSDDELEENEAMPKRRAVKIDDNNECEDDEAPSLKQIFNGVERNCETDDEDNIPISQLVRTRGRGSRRSVRLQERNISSQISDDYHTPNCPRRRLVKCGQRGHSDNTRRMKKKYVEDEESDENDSGSDDSLSSFIVSDTNVEDLEDELSEDGERHSSENEEASDDNLGFKNIISTLQRHKNPNSKWVFEADMLSDFGKDPGLCMRGVCAIYRRQITKVQKLWPEGVINSRQGFSKYDEPRGSALANFLTGGNPDGDIVKTVEELEAFDPEGPKQCWKLASHYSKQLFEIYKDKEDPFFP